MNDEAQTAERIVQAAGLDAAVQRTGEVAWRLQRVRHFLGGKRGMTLSPEDLKALSDASRHFDRMYRTLRRRRGGPERES